MVDVASNPQTVREPAKVKRGHAFSLPNLLTYGRCVAVPLVAACLFWSDILEGGVWLRWVAVVIYVVAAVTDFFDGYLARLREFLAELRVSVPVTRLAKWKTTAQLVAVGVLLAGPAADLLVPGITLFGIGLLWIAALLTLYTGWDYFRAGARHLIGDDA